MISVTVLDPGVFLHLICFSVLPCGFKLYIHTYTHTHRHTERKREML